MKAIITKFHGPGNVKGSRVSASDEDGNRVVIGWVHSMNAVENHRKAAETLAQKKGWKGQLIGGGLKNAYVWVFADSNL